jgi:hypothetical protein
MHDPLGIVEKHKFEVKIAFTYSHENNEFEDSKRCSLTYTDEMRTSCKY